MVVDTLNPQFIYTPRMFDAQATDRLMQFEETNGNNKFALYGQGIFWPSDLARSVKAALDKEGDSVYDAVFAPDTRKFTISSDGSGGGGVFNIEVAGSGWARLGFTSNKSGSLSYVGDVAVPAQKTITLVERMRRPQLEQRPAGSLTEIDSGARWAVFQGIQDRYTFLMEFEKVSESQDVWRMIRDAGLLGQDMEFRPSAASTDGVKIQIVRDSFQWVTPVYRRYAMVFQIEIVRPADSGDDFIARDLLDRGPV